ncbi:MAG TPA: hypothetical protein VMX74_07025, partial [Pirellulales bacterium]|nr:hypothetical protein [Pirellulales bacterium]
MPDLPNRTAEEKALEDKLVRLFARYRDAAIGRLGDPPNIHNIPSFFWAEIANEIARAIQPTLERVHRDSAGRFDKLFGLRGRREEHSIIADVWSNQRAYAMADDLAARIRDSLSVAVMDAKRDWRALLIVAAVAFSVERAERIAVTELSGAVSAGELTERGRIQAALDAGRLRLPRSVVQRAGGPPGPGGSLETVQFVIEAYWQTENDFRVCPLCSPLQGKPERVWAALYPRGPGPGGPHPNCRCWLRYELEFAESVDYRVHDGNGGDVLVEAEEGVWRTIRGVHVFIKDGKITKGPKKLVGKKPDEIDDDEPAEKAKVKQTETAAFKKWFGDSKVVDENGEPLVVYHGTDQAFTAFDPEAAGNSTGNWGWYGKGAGYFTDSAKTAGEFTHDRPGANVIPVFLRIEKPFFIDDVPPRISGRERTLVSDLLSLEGLTADEREWLSVESNSSKKYGDAVLEFAFGESRPNLVRKASAAVRLTELMKANGYDGVKIQMQHDDEHHFVVFDSNQIKSATGNRGKF